MMNNKHKNTRHGHGSPTNQSPTYRSWMAMKTRCTNKKHKHLEGLNILGLLVWCIRKQEWN